MADNQSPVLYNTDTKQAETLPEGQLEDAIISGTHSYAADKDINVVDGSGRSSSVKAVDLPKVLQQGYKIESPKQGAIREYLEDNDNVKGSVKTFAANVLNEAALGIPELIYNKKGDPLEVAKWEALKNQNEISSLAGSGVGIISSLFAPGASAVFKGASKVGGLAEKAVADGLKAYGVQKGSESIAKDLLARTAAKSASMGVEGALISTPIAITEAALGDPEQAAESLISGGLIGGALGFGTGTVQSGWQRYLKSSLRKAEGEAASKLGSEIKKSASGDVESIIDKNEGNGVIQDPLVDPTGAVVNDSPGKQLINDAAALGAPDLTLKSLAKGMGKLKENYKEIVNAAKQFVGLKLDEAALSSSKEVERINNYIEESPYKEGLARREAKENNYKIIDGEVKNSFADAKELSPYAQGAEFKKGITDEVTRLKEPLSEGFEKLGIVYDHIPVDAGERKRIVSEIMNSEAVRNNHAGVEKLLQFAKTLEEEGTLKSLSELKNKKTNALRDFGAATTQAEKAAAAELANHLSELEKNSALKFAESLDNPQAISSVKNALQEREMLNGKWSELMDFIKEGGEGFGKKNIRSPSDFLDYINGMTNEKLAGMFYKRNDFEFMKFLKDRFPEQFKTMISSQKSDILNKFSKNGSFNMNGFFKELFDNKKFPKEIRETMFSPEDLQKFKSAKLLLDEGKYKLNPSGTDVRNELREHWSLGGMASNLLGKANVMGQEAVLKSMVNVDGILATEQAMKHTNSRLEKIADHLDNLSKKESFKNSSPATTNGIRRIYDQMKDKPKNQHEGYRQISNRISHVATNDAALINILNTFTKALTTGGAPNISSSVVTKTAATLNYINQQMPKPAAPPSPLAPYDYKPTSYEMQKFETIFMTALDPLSTLDDLKEGVLTQEQVTTFQNTAPKLYDYAKDKVMDWVLNNKKELPYNSRSQISLFLQEPLDSSLQPQAIIDFQSTFGSAKDNQPTVKGAKNLNMAEAAQTDTQRRLAPA